MTTDMTAKVDVAAMAQTIVDLRAAVELSARLLGARVKVENELWLIGAGAAPLPDREKCREWAQRLGIPEEIRGIMPGPGGKAAPCRAHGVEGA